jgi:hypothetical protein
VAEPSCHLAIMSTMQLLQVIEQLREMDNRPVWQLKWELLPVSQFGFNRWDVCQSVSLLFTYASHSTTKSTVKRLIDVHWGSYHWLDGLIEA